MRAATNWKPPAICLLVGLALITVPDPIASSIRSQIGKLRNAAGHKSLMQLICNAV